MNLCRFSIINVVLDVVIPILVQHGTYSTLENVVHPIIRSVEYTAIHSIVDQFGFN